MKKLVLVFVSAVFFAACSGKEGPETSTQPPCTINGHDCWKVVKLLPQTKVIPTGDFTYTYENPALQNWGITVTAHDMYQDGGSTYHILNNEVFIYTNHKMGSPRSQLGAVTVRFKKDPKSDGLNFDGPVFEYTPQGRLIKENL